MTPELCLADSMVSMILRLPLKLSHLLVIPSWFIFPLFAESMITYLYSRHGD